VSRPASAGGRLHDVRGLGNRIRHEYWRVDPALIWSIAVDDLPALRAAIEDLRRRAFP